MQPTRCFAARLLASSAVAVLLAACGGGGSAPTANETPAQAAPPSPADTSLDALRIPAGEASVAAIAPSLRSIAGPVDVWVSLADPALSLKKRELRPDVPGRSWKATDDVLKAQLNSHKQLLQSKQASAMSSLAGLGASELGRVYVSHNALAVKVDAARLKDIAALPGVVAVRPVRHYELMLGETVTYVGGRAAQAAGKDGTGVRVAVLDSGIDYTHRNLGGAGTAAAYTAAWGTSTTDARNTTRDGLFPTAKVVDGFDFVGEAWPNAARTEDPDPIDLEGHGTHVADIIAGIGPNKGMAPGAKLVAVKVCSAVATSCNGIALLKAMDFALDPNGDGDLSDAVDVINLSLGQSYGQEEDDLSFATSNAVALGVSVVASAGNSANRPYIVGSPSSALGVLSVAQTQVPSATSIPLVIVSPASIAGTAANTATVDWAPLGNGFSGEVKLASATGAANNLACVALAAGSLAGKVALIDRGTCNASVKVHNAAVAGAIGVLIANNAAGDAPSFSFGGPDPFTAAPTLVITQATGNLIKSQIAAPVIVSVSAASAISLVGSVASTSSRGPDSARSSIKPEIGAPGASLSAEATTGTGETVFGGTSGAAPMVSGAAAILRAAFPDRSPSQIKAMLMNSANTSVYTNPATQPGVLAPISRIGAGELRVDRAMALLGVAYDKKAMSAALSFGFAEVAANANLGGQLVIENFSNSARTYAIGSSYRYAADAASGATTIEAPGSVTVAAGGSATIDVRMKVDGTKLPAWNFASAGVTGGTGSLLEGNEVDGYVTLSSGGETLTVPFHALLRKSSSLSVTGAAVKAGSDIALQNSGGNAGAFEAFALTGTSGRVAKNLLPGLGDNATVVDLRAVGVRAVGTNVQFAVSRWDRRAHPTYPAEIDIYVDSDGDGTDDYAIFNAENGAFASSGQTLVAIFNLRTGASPAFFFLDADLQSGNGIFTVPMAAVGLTPSSKFKFSVYALDNYFTGNVTDAIEGMTHTLGAPRYALAGGVTGGAVGARSTVRVATAAAVGSAAASPSQTGFLMLFRQNKDLEAELVTVNP